MRSWHRRSAALAVFIALAALPPCAAQNQPADSRETWMGVYLGDQKIGYLKMAFARTQYAGQDVYRVDNAFHTKVRMSGAGLEQDVSTRVYFNLKMGPVFEELTMASGGTTTRVEAVYKPGVVQCKLISQGTASPKDLPIPAGVSLVGDSNLYCLADKSLRLGDRFTFSYFNSLALAIETLSAEVLREEKLDIKGTIYNTLVVKSVTPMGEVTAWKEPNGDVVKMVGLMGMTMIRETKEEAMGVQPNGIEQPPADLALLTSVKANIDLPRPERIRQLTVSIIGIGDPKLMINDNRQKVTASHKEGRTAADFVITAKNPNWKHSARLPIKLRSLQAFLTEEPYIQCTNPRITKQARLIVGAERRSIYAAGKIRKWVYGNMRKQGDMGIVRSALDVLNSKSGMCRDYAALYTALARAAGIPTRLVAGLVFHNGSFYYHAWGESFTGEWIPFDATLPGDFVDATHIKLTQGDATSMFEIAKVIGGLSAEISDYKYLEK